MSCRYFSSNLTFIIWLCLWWFFLFCFLSWWYIFYFYKKKLSILSFMASRFGIIVKKLLFFSVQDYKRMNLCFLLVVSLFTFESCIYLSLCTIQRIQLYFFSPNSYLLAPMAFIKIAHLYSTDLSCWLYCNLNSHVYLYLFLCFLFLHWSVCYAS